jgi:hypothetical protein
MFVIVLHLLRRKRLRYFFYAVVTRLGEVPSCHALSRRA